MDWRALEGAVEREHWAEALRLALAGWRAARHPLLGDLIDALAVRAEDTIALGNEPEAKARFWLPRTAGQRYGAWIARIARLEKEPDDPRIAQAIVAEITRAPWVLMEEDDARTVIGWAFRLLARTADPRTIPLLRALVAKPVAKKRLVREYLRTALPAVIAEIEGHGEPATDVARAEALLQRLGAASAAPVAVAGKDEATLRALVLEELDDDAPRAVLADHWLERGDPRGSFIALQLKPSAKNDKAARALLREHEAQWLGDLAHVTKKPRVYRRGFLTEIALLKPGVAGPERWADAAAAPALATVEKIEGSRGNFANYLPFILSPAARSLRSITVFTKGMLESLLAHDGPLPARELTLELVLDAKTATTLARSLVFPALERVTFGVRHGGTTKLIDAAESFLAARPLAIGARSLEWGGDAGEFAPFLAAILGRLAAAPSVSLLIDELFHLTARRGSTPNAVRVELLCRHLRFADEVLRDLRLACAIEEVALRLPPWFDEVLVPQDPALVRVLDGLNVVPDAAWAAFLGNRTAGRA